MAAWGKEVNDRLSRRRNDLGQVHYFVAEGQFPTRTGAEVEEVVDELQRPPCLAFGHVACPSGVGLEVPFARDRFQSVDDRGEWAAQLVRQRREPFVINRPDFLPGLRVRTPLGPARNWADDCDRRGFRVCIVHRADLPGSWCGEQQSNEDRDDRDHHEPLDHGERPAARGDPAA